MLISSLNNIRFNQKINKLVKILIEKEINSNTSYDIQILLLSYASKKGDLDTIEILLKKGIDISIYAEEALLNASINGHYHIVNFLIENGLSVDNKDGIEALNSALKYGHIDIVKILLEKGVDINNKDEFNIYITLEAAIESSNVELVKLLVENGANIYNNYINQISPLMYIAKHLRECNEEFYREKYKEMSYIIIRKMADDYIKLFISLNKNIETPQKAKDKMNNYIKLLYSLQNLPDKIFLGIIKHLYEVEEIS